MQKFQADESQRGHGFTKLQMSHAPLGAIYVWPTSNLSYPVALARQGGRGDLEIVGPWVFDRNGEWLRGKRVSAIVVDHACLLEPEEIATLRELRASLV